MCNTLTKEVTQPPTQATWATNLRQPNANAKWHSLLSHITNSMQSLCTHQETVLYQIQLKLSLEAVEFQRMFLEQYKDVYGTYIYVTQREVFRFVSTSLSPLITDMVHC